MQLIIIISMLLVAQAVPYKVVTRQPRGFPVSPRRLKNSVCGETPEEPVSGTKCNGGLKRYTYYVATNECKSFIYGGCLGNKNNFHTMQDCVEICRFN
ncbi:kunitz-type serine protease inhibitor HCRG1-like [Drosophila busckii]|uniref:kunitz-type serine protease inhibitor HCRG1-like n=1 Tax=Drosophila busckii TaxID=30019 RepID=UPI00083F40F9|nr:kunitz-type serine protease inhibitor HCRG1-like [Drosophila busckii]